MANNPCFGVMICPHCKRNIPVFWDGNFRLKCPHCEQIVTIKRQKLFHVKPYNRKE